MERVSLREMETLVVAHKDRLCRFGFDFVEWFCNMNGCNIQIISFEHLGNLRPQRGKYSKRSNGKRAYWLKSQVYEQVKRIAYQDYIILTTRVSPRNTSRLTPWGEPVWRGTTLPSNLLDFANYEPGTPLVATVNGYKAHSGVNAARNIALKAIKRHLEQVTLNLKSQKR